jgi:hypothetical protein
MIQVTFDKESEYQWIRFIMEAGVLNLHRDTIKTLEDYHIPTKHMVTYKQSDCYENDIVKDGE